MKQQTCNRCRLWSSIDGRKFLGICGHRDHGGEMTDRTEGGNCADFETAEPMNGKKPGWVE